MAPESKDDEWKVKEYDDDYVDLDEVKEAPEDGTMQTAEDQTSGKRSVKGTAENLQEAERLTSTDGLVEGIESFSTRDMRPDRHTNEVDIKEEENDLANLDDEDLPAKHKKLSSTNTSQRAPTSASQATRGGHQNGDALRGRGGQQNAGPQRVKPEVDAQSVKQEGTGSKPLKSSKKRSRDEKREFREAQSQLREAEIAAQEAAIIQQQQSLHTLHTQTELQLARLRMEIIGGAMLQSGQNFAQGYSQPQNQNYCKSVSYGSRLQNRSYSDSTFRGGQPQTQTENYSSSGPYGDQSYRQPHHLSQKQGGVNIQPSPIQPAQTGRGGGQGEHGRGVRSGRRGWSHRPYRGRGRGGGRGH
ncbi:hypothetical protein BKA64DRAFT_716096 [Cadophora sp. MPI-SDFR-AT-0126]|nr:hypothetical protein BKA64DRAFT_716096 [Leotiomycetes sp. MPI-SDFR-AT-0126]